jgi:hypothetical protein
MVTKLLFGHPLYFLKPKNLNLEPKHSCKLFQKKSVLLQIKNTS